MIARLLAGPLRCFDNRALAVFINIAVMSVSTNGAVVLVSALVDVRQAALWFMCLSTGAFFFLADAGVSYAFSRQLAHNRHAAASGTIGAGGGLMIRFFLRRSAMPFTILAVGLGAYLFLVRLHAEGDGRDWRQMTTLWSVVCFYMFFSVLSKFLQMANEGLGRLANERYIVSFCQIGILIVAIPAVYLTHSVYALGFVFCLGYALQATCLYLSTGPGSHPSPISWAVLVRLRKDSMKLWLLNGLTQLSQNIQIMSLAFFLDMRAVAAFFFLQRLDSGASNLVGNIIIIDRAKISYSLGCGDYQMVLTLVRRNMNYVMLATAACCMMLGLLVWFCNAYGMLKFQVPYILLIMFILDLLFNGVFGVLGQYVLAVGRNPLLPWTAASSFATVALQFVLVPRFGSSGAIGAYILAQVSTLYVGNVIHLRRLLIDLRMARDGDEHMRSLFQPKTASVEWDLA